MSRRLRTVAALVCAAVVVDCAEIPTGPPTGDTPDPSGAIPALQPSQLYLDTLAGSDSLMIRVLTPAPIAHRLFLWLPDNLAGDSVSLSLALTEPRIVMDSVTVGGADLARQRWVFLPPMATPTEFVIVVKRRAGASSIDVALSLEPRDARPEHSDSTLVVADTITESIDGANDIDQFKVTGVAGKQLILFVSKRFSTAPLPLTILAFDQGGNYWHLSTQSVADHEFEQRAIPLGVPAGQTWRIRVSGVTSSGGAALPPEVTFLNGEYRLLLVAVDSAPESASAILAPGDTVSDAIDYAGDVDVFTVSLATPRRLAFGIKVSEPAAPAVRLQVGDNFGTQFILDAASPTTHFDSLITPAWEFGAGTIRVRVLGGLQGRRDSILTEYQLEVFEVDGAPETASPAVVIGATVNGETIGRLRDYDDFEVPVVAGQGLRFESTGAVKATMYLPNTYDQPTLDAHPQTGTEFRASGPIVAGTTGSATLRIEPRDGKVGPYSFTFNSMNPAPETADSVLVLNTMATESIEHAGDLDRFGLTVPATDRYIGFLRRKLAGGAYADSIFIGPIERNAGFDIPFSVSSMTFPYTIGQPLEYEIGAFVIDTMPEERPEAFAISDTVVGLVDLRSDVDVYKLTFAGPDEKVFRINWIEAPPCYVDFPSMTMHISISGVWSWGIYSPSTWQANNETFALSVPGTYSVRVASRYASWDGVGCHIPQYAFTIEEVTRP